jgi:hypothetical protein
MLISEAYIIAGKVDSLAVASDTVAMELGMMGA